MWIYIHTVNADAFTLILDSFAFQDKHAALVWPLLLLRIFRLIYCGIFEESTTILKLLDFPQYLFRKKSKTHSRSTLKR